MDIGTFLQIYGYPLVIIGTLIEGEVALLAAGYLIHRGYLEWWPVWLLAALGASGGDQFFFQLGRHYGERLIQKLPRITHAPLETARKLVRRHTPYVLVVMRFMVGMRMVLPALLGSAHVRVWRFTLFDVTMAVIWSAIFLTLGYLFGAAAERFIEHVQRIQISLLIVIVIAAVIYQVISKRVVVKRVEKKESQE